MSDYSNIFDPPLPDSIETDDLLKDLHQDLPSPLRKNIQGLTLTPYSSQLNRLLSPYPQNAHNELFSSQAGLNHTGQTLDEDVSEMASFNDLYTYVANVLNGWSLDIGYLKYSSQNYKTVRCIMQLIKTRQKDQEYRSKSLEDLQKVQYERDTAKATIVRITNELDQTKKKMGALENKSRAQETRLKTWLEKINSQKTDLVQAKAKLEQKNNQILHEIKKKEVQLNRVKDSVRKPQQKGVLKNGFEILGQFVNKNEKSEDSPLVTLLKERYQGERKIYMRENRILRQQIDEMQTPLIELIKWLKEQLGNSRLKDASHILAQHNLCHTKARLAEQLSSIINDTKKALLVFMNDCLQKADRSEVCPGSQASSSKKQEIRSTNKMSHVPQRQIQARQTLSYQGGRDSLTNNLTTPYTRKKLLSMAEQTSSNMQKGQSSSQHRVLAHMTSRPAAQKLEALTRKDTLPAAVVSHNSSGVNEKESSNMIVFKYPKNSRSMPAQEQEEQLSMISHISMKQVPETKLQLEETRKNQYDKWDILFDD